jgi:DNA polymerase I-like protein with 3'-5' exonuclease and polymerase domains
MAWNHKFDGQIFQKYHIYYRGTVIDGMLAKYVLNEEKPNGLKDMTRRYLPEYGNYESEKGFDKIPWDQKPLDQLCQYGGQDTDYTFRLCIFFEKKLIDLGLYDLFRNLIMPASRVLQSVEANGLYIDREFNEKLLEEYKKKIDKALDNILNLPRVKRFHKYLVEQRVEKYIGKVQAEIDKLNDEYKAARGERDSAKVRASIEKKIASREQKIVNVRMGIYSTKGERELEKPINLGSPVDLPLLVYDEHGFGFECTEFTDTGNPSTAEDTLQQLRLTVKKPDNPKAIFLDNLLDLRGLQKMYTTFIEGWHDKTQDDNKLHGSFKIHGTTSGRLSSSEPNLQQIPKTSVDPNIKKQLVAAPGTLYISSDFSQAELRIMAHLSGDETYLQAFASGNDPHLAIACKKYHVPYEEILPIYKDEKHPDHKMWSVRRKQAKQLAFGLIYGIGPGLLAVKLSDPKSGIIVTKEEAKQQMDEYFAKHPALQKFKAKQERILKRQGFIKSLFGRKRRLPQIWSDNHDEQAYAIRLGLNFPCQSAASDMCLFGSILIYYLMRQGKLPMMNSVTLVHDANYFNALPETINTWDLYEMWKIFSNPSTKKYFGFQIDDVLMDMDYHVGRTMAEELPFIPGYDYRKMLEPDFDVDEYMKEAKKYGDIPISDYPKHFAKQMKKYEEDFKAGKY